MKPATAIIAAHVLLLATSAAIAADAGSLMQNCNACHGDQGVSQWSDVPTIAGLAEFVHSDALFVYRDGERPCPESAYRQGNTDQPATTMCAVAESLSDEDIEALAAAYAKLPYVRAKQEFDASLAAAGEAVHDEHCDRCHSDGGTNPEDEAGMLGGQWMDYLEESMRHFAAGERPQPDKMQEKVAALSDDDIKALLHYYASLQ